MRSQTPDTLVKLILSINRREPVAASMENVDLAIKYAKLYPSIVCGVDLSGDPAQQQFNDFMPLLQKAKEHGLKLALHCGEIDNQAEITAMLNFGMNRLGHGTYINGMNESFEKSVLFKILRQKI